MLNFPATPSVPSEQRGRATVSLRYEDIAQDGRVRLDALPPSLGEAVWRTAIRNHPAQKFVSEHGIVPILSRMTLLGTSETVSVSSTLDAEGCFELASCFSASGEVERIVLNMWVEVFGTSGLTYGSHANPGQRVVVGRIFAEHVFTRLFAPPSERKVLRLPGGAVPEIPPAVYVWQPTEQLIAPVESVRPAAPSEAKLSLDPFPLSFGVTHTDSNQHVNSLVYPQHFEEAVLRRASAIGLPTSSMLARGFEISYRKPSFAGENVRVALRLFFTSIDGVERLGAQGCFVDASTTDDDLASGRAKPRCAIRMLFA